MLKTHAPTQIGIVAFAAAFAIGIITLLTILGELTPPVKDSLKRLFSHHWVGKSAIAMIGFFVAGIALSLTNLSHTPAAMTKRIWLLFFVTIGCTLFLTGFFFWEAFIKPH